MSIFSRFKTAKKAAKEHKAKVSKELNKDDIPKVPYKHVPTHAAVDALSGAPSSWKHEDRSKIMEHNKRRTIMGMSRSGSSLSTRTWNENSSTPTHPSLLRASSYNSYTPTWNDRGDYSYLNEPYHKRKKISRNHSFNDSGIGPSPLGSNVTSEQVSPAGSSNSSLTEEDLEIAPRPRPQSNTFHHKEIVERLHSSKIRKVGEAPIRISRIDQAPLTPNSQVAPTACVVAQAEKDQKRRWLMKGKGRQDAIAA